MLHPTIVTIASQPQTIRIVRIEHAPPARDMLQGGAVEELSQATCSLFAVNLLPG